MLKKFLWVFSLVSLLSSCIHLLERQPSSVRPELTTAFGAEDSSGEFTAQIKWDFDPDLGTDVLRGAIQFSPKANLACNKIGFIQIARVLKENGESYHWLLGEAARNEIATKNSSKGKGGFYIDHRADDCKTQKDCSPYFTDYWPNEGGSSFGSSNDKENIPAKLLDFPFGWTEYRSIELQACAVCDDNGKIYGCLQWGGEWPAIGDRQITSPQFSEKASASFVEALRNFRSYYSR